VPRIQNNQVTINIIIIFVVLYFLISKGERERERERRKGKESEREKGREESRKEARSPYQPESWEFSSNFRCIFYQDTASHFPLLNNLIRNVWVGEGNTNNQKFLLSPPSLEWKAMMNVYMYVRKQ
jgi:hypothetical protein